MCLCVHVGAGDGPDPATARWIVPGVVHVIRIGIWRAGAAKVGTGHQHARGDGAERHRTIGACQRGRGQLDIHVGRVSIHPGRPERGGAREGLGIAYHTIPILPEDRIVQWVGSLVSPE